MAAGSKVKSVNRKEWKMSDYIQENTKEIPVKYQPDVAVAGGGIAGIAAALAAARNGADVL